MTQLDVPQISLSRYVDLLKRRRWQVVPISLLGLLIGGIVAFFIPRDFLSKTDIEYRQPPGFDPKNREDPFGGIVDNVKLTLPMAILETIKTLGWPEALTEDPYELSTNADEIEGRLRIYESGKSSERGYALIRVTYKDRDGERAAAFLNRLVATWIKQERDLLRRQTEKELSDAQEEEKGARAAYEGYLDTKKQLEKTYRIVPDAPVEWQIASHRDAQAHYREALDSLEKQRSEVAALEGVVGHLRQALLDMPARVPLDEKVLMAKVLELETGKQLQEQILLLTLARDAFNREHPQWAVRDRRLQAALQELRRLVGEQVETDPDGMIPNPDRVKAEAELSKKELDLVQAKARLEALEKKLQRERERLASRADGFAQYLSNQESLREAEEAMRAAAKRVAEVRARLGQLTSAPPVRQVTEARVPPVPTEPNLMLVALIGCVIGLLAAVGLVLLLDIVQATFKTVDDVERGLDVPVLGSVSYLETQDQRRRATRSRRRASMFAAAVLVLASGVVLIYIYDPTRLPPFVRDLLAMVLGDA